MRVWHRLRKPAEPPVRDEMRIGIARNANGSEEVLEAARRALREDAYRVDGAEASVLRPKIQCVDPAFLGHLLFRSDFVGARELRAAVAAGINVLDIEDGDGYRPGHILVAKVCGAVDVNSHQFQLWKLSEAHKLKVVFDDEVLRHANGSERLPSIRNAIEHGFESQNPALESGRYNFTRLSHRSQDALAYLKYL